MISIITPFYKGNAYMLELTSCIHKAVAFNNLKGIDCQIELIIVNDSPETLVIIPKKSFNYDIRIINNKKNMGIQATRVIGLRQARGEYILFLDQDDKITESCIFSQLSVLQTSNADVIIGNAIIEEETYNHLFYNNGFAQKCSKNIKFYEYVNNQIFSPGQCIIKKSVIPEFWKSNILTINGADDLMLWLLLFEKKCTFEINKDVIYRHCYTGENLSYDLDKMFDSVKEMINLLKKYNACNPKILEKIYNCQLYKNKYRKTTIIGKLFLSIRYFRYSTFNFYYRIMSRLGGQIYADS